MHAWSNTATTMLLLSRTSLKLSMMIGFGNCRKKSWQGKLQKQPDKQNSRTTSTTRNSWAASKIPGLVHCGICNGSMVGCHKAGLHQNVSENVLRRVSNMQPCSTEGSAGVTINT